MQDIGMISLVRQTFPNFEIHASTQLHNHNNEGIKALKDLGVTKVVLDREKDKACISIEDTGSGIKEDKIAYLFDKFYTANDYGNATNGAGLGLNIVKNIVDLHGGSIEVLSTVGKGTRVNIKI